MVATEREVDRGRTHRSPRYVVVIGGASGIGAATATLLADADYRVVIADRDIDAAEGLAGTIMGASAAFLDVRDAANVEEFFSGLAGSGGNLAGVVHCPAIGQTRSFLDIERADWDAQMAVNLRGAFLVCRQAGRMMKEQGNGSIVLLSSVAAQRPSYSGSVYASSKAALEHLVKCLAQELGAAGVRVNAVAPGATETPLVQKLHTAETRAALTARIPLGRYGETGEIAQAIRYLLSDDAQFVTAQLLYVDGGMSIPNYLPERS